MDFNEGIVAVRYSQETLTIIVVYKSPKTSEF